MLLSSSWLSRYKPDVLREDVLVERKDWRDERIPSFALKWEEEEFLAPEDNGAVAVAVTVDVAVCVAVVRSGVVR